MPVSIVLKSLQDGMTIDELMEQYQFTREQITARRLHSRRSLETFKSRLQRFAT